MNTQREGHDQVPVIVRRRLADSEIDNLRHVAELFRVDGTDGRRRILRSNAAGAAPCEKHVVARFCVSGVCAIKDAQKRWNEFGSDRVFPVPPTAHIAFGRRDLTCEFSIGPGLPRTLSRTIKVLSFTERDINQRCQMGTRVLQFRVWPASHPDLPRYVAIGREHHRFRACNWTAPSNGAEQWNISRLKRWP